jgi:ribosome-associated toxin RatA of RatAB toxin-antitoxin module
MQTVRIEALVFDRLAPDVYETVVDFARYPALVDTVREVRLDPAATDGSLICHWSVNFRNGVLRWSEFDTFDRVNLISHFTQTSGDFEFFRGEWMLRPKGDDVVVTFESEFDFGVPTLAAIIDPVAVRVLTESMRKVLLGLFNGAVKFLDAGLAIGVA